MAIYFGNLDRELAERQDVLKEDAARQYHGSREVMKAFSDLGTQVASNIERLGVPEWLRGDATYDDKGKMVRGGWGGAGTQDVEVAKIDYNLHRQTESDRLRNEQHKDLRLQRRLTNIEGYNKVRASQHSALQWNNNNPKAVQTRYEDRMKVLDKDLRNVAPVERILAYPQLFGADAVRQVATLKKLEEDGDEVAAKQARDNLPLAPLPFMKWATEQKYFNDKITGNPLAVGNRMYTAALREADYNIPDPEEMNKSFSKEYVGNAVKELSPEEIRKQEELLNAKNVNENLSILVGRDKDLLKKEKRLKTLTELNQENLDEGGSLPELKVDGSNVWVSPSGDTFSLGDDGVKPLGVNNLSVEEAAASEAGGVTSKVRQSLAEEAKIAVEQLTSIDEDTLRYQKYHRDKMRKSPGYPGNELNQTQKLAVANSNQFTIGLGEQVSNEVMLSRDEVKRDPGDELYTLQGPERDREPAFFPFMEASRGRKLGAYYGKLPNYSTWENVDPVEKARILEHPDTVKYGASPKSVAGLIKAEDELEQIDKQILFINGQTSQAGTGTQVEWKQGQQKTDYLVQDSEEFLIPSVSSDIFPGGGRLSPEAQGAISNVKTQQAKNIAKQLPRLENQRKQLAARVKYARADVDASHPLDIMGNSKYKGRDWGKPSVLPSSLNEFPSSGRPIIRPEAEPIPNFNEMGRPTISTDLGAQAAVRANLAEDTQQEIIGGIIEREGWGPADAGYSYFDGTNPDERGYYKADGGETLTLAGGNNIWGTINSMPVKERKGAIEEVATNLFGNGGVRRKEFIKFMDMPKKDHKKEYDTIVKRGRLRLTKGQRDYLTSYSYKNHLDRLVKNHPYLSDIAQYPKEMQVFLMDNTFNMGPRWLKDKFTKTEEHLRRWVKTRLPSDLEKMKEEYKNSDHYRETTRAKDLVAMLIK
jgi:hypothetical protein